LVVHKLLTGAGGAVYLHRLAYGEGEEAYLAVGAVRTRGAADAGYMHGVHTLRHGTGSDVTDRLPASQGAVAPHTRLVTDHLPLAEQPPVCIPTSVLLTLGTARLGVVHVGDAVVFFEAIADRTFDVSTLPGTVTLGAGVWPEPGSRCVHLALVLAAFLGGLLEGGGVTGEEVEEGEEEEEEGLHRGSIC